MASERELGGFSSPHDLLGGVGEETCEDGWMAEKPFAEEGKMDDRDDRVKVRNKLNR
jgi:hypothetical protein